MNLTLITHAIAALAAAGAVWVFQDARWAADVADIRLEQANDRERANSELRARQHAITTRYEGALNEARTREASLRRDRAAAAAESDGLRAQLSDTARRIAAAPPAAVAEYATATGELLADCSRSYQELAEKADGHAADVRTFVEAWPR